MRKSLLIFSLLFFQINAARAQNAEAVTQVGDHSILFTFEKNENPENIMIVYTKLDASCHVVVDPARQAAPVFDMYWLMNGTGYKPVHNLIKSGVLDRLQVIPSKNDSFQIQINDLKELQTDVQDPKLSVVAEKNSNGACEVKSMFKLGASDKGATMQVQTIYSEAAKTLMPPFRKLKSVTLKGVDAKTGEKISRTYKAK